MTEGDGVVPGEHAPFDEVDANILQRLRAAVRRIDPVPDGLAERAQFAAAWLEVEAEVADIQRASGAILAGVRVATPHLPTSVTFSVTDVSLVVSATPRGGDRVRLDGWLTPPDSYRVALRMQEETMTVRATDGRFAVDEVPAGLVQFAVGRAGMEGDVMVTPAVQFDAKPLAP